MRSPKKTSSLKRSNPTRSPYNYILIVCEGEKTEPNYFKEARKFYSINTANVEICGDSCGSSPKNIVAFAKEAARIESYDEVFCVFDKDKHESFQAAISQVDELNRSGRWPKFNAIVSIPCFEIWIILHHKYTTKEYTEIPKKSICDQVIKDIDQNFFPNYEKGSFDTFIKLIKFMDRAIDHAKKLQTHIEATGAAGPKTDIYKLVEVLRTLKDT